MGNAVLPSFSENRSMLTDSKLKNAKPGARPYKLVDGQGLHALVQTSGSILWQQRYRYEGKERTASHGSYPLVSLLEAWAVPGFKDTLLRCLMEPEVFDGATQEVFQGVQA